MPDTVQEEPGSKAAPLTLDAVERIVKGNNQAVLGEVAKLFQGSGNKAGDNGDGGHEYDDMTPEEFSKYLLSLDGSGTEPKVAAKTDTGIDAAALALSLSKKHIDERLASKDSEDVKLRLLEAIATKISLASASKEERAAIFTEADRLLDEEMESGRKIGPYFVDQVLFPAARSVIKDSKRLQNVLFGGDEETGRGMPLLYFPESNSDEGSHGLTSAQLKAASEAGITPKQFADAYQRRLAEGGIE